MEIDVDNSRVKLNATGLRMERGVIVPIVEPKAPNIVIPTVPNRSKPQTTTNSTGNIPMPPKRTVMNIGGLTRMPFTFQIANIETAETMRVRFFDAHMQPYQYSMSSSEEGFSRPFAPSRNAQSVEAPSEQYNFSDLFLDRRYNFLGTEDGKSPPDIDAILEKLKSFMRPNVRRMRKPRLSILYGAKIIGTPGVDYLYMNSLSVNSDQSDDEGKYVTATISMSFTLYSNQ